MRVRLPVLTVLALVASTVVPASGLAGGAVVLFNASIGQCYADGNATAIAGNQLRIKHRATDGTLKKTHQIDVTGNYFEISCPGPKVEIGDRFQFFSGDAATPFRTFKVPELTLRTDRVRDRISGTAKGTTEVGMIAAVCDAASFGCTGAPEEPIPVDPKTHRFSKQLADDLTGLWQFVLYWSDGDDTVTLQQRAAGLLVRPGSAVVGRAGPRVGRSVVVSVRRGQSTAVGTATTKRGAAFKTTIRRNDTQMSLGKDDVVSSDIASDATMTVPPTNLQADGQFVWGRCLKNRTVTVLVYDDQGGFENWQAPTSDVDGRWQIDQETSPGWQVQAWCANRRGDVIRRDLTVD